MNYDCMVIAIWKLVKKLKQKCINSANKNDMLRSIIVFCAQSHNEDFFSMQYCFPSIILKEIALDKLSFSKKTFKLNELLKSIVDKNDEFTEDDSDTILLLLTDTLLYRAYQLINESSYGGLLSQLNMCIILDSMKIRPDQNVDVSSILLEVSEKAKLCAEKLSSDTIWAIAMLNYKMHIYDTAIFFFKKYLMTTNKENDLEVCNTRIRAKIYIGYCNEKSMDKLNGFNSAIETFSKLLDELENDKEPDQRLITELHHGLGHFYNERAIFGNSDTKCFDILKARKHMKMALDKKADYYSCYGSLFHEYGDYINAQQIFDEAMENSEIQANNELKSEMRFYKAQTGSALAINQDEQVEVANEDFNAFENYCKQTFNYDGIVHARIFKIRIFLRSIEYGINLANQRKSIRRNVNLLYSELNEYALSNYASKSIKDEYAKTKCILNIFRVLYADNKFIWHMEDLQYYIQSFMELMPKDIHVLDYTENCESPESIISNLYQIGINGLNVWCVSSNDLKNIICQDKFEFDLSNNGLKITNLIPIENLLKAHNCIKGNGKPDLVVLIPPEKKDSAFETEVRAIIDTSSESYFIYSRGIDSKYDLNWVKEEIRSPGVNLYCTETICDMFRQAYCYRGLEILRKELLQPIPLFSLAPTHFSSSYDFQLGEDIEIQDDYLDKEVEEREQRKIRKQLNFVDKRYSSCFQNINFIKNSSNALAEFIEKGCNSGILTVCFPAPSLNLSEENNYISYCVKDAKIFHNEGFVHNLTEGNIYTIKALPSYRKLFYELELELDEHSEDCQSCEDCEECSIYHETLLTSESNIASHFREILNVIFSNEDVNLKYPYKCVLKKFENTLDSKKYIYLIIQNDKSVIKLQESAKHIYEINEEVSNDMPISVFVTYAWEPENSEFEEYQMEVYNFTNILRENHFDASFDLAESSNNWSQIMIKGLQKDKVIVLLSKEYKRKADKTINSGVSFESKALMELLNTYPEKVIFARLPSQKEYSITEIKPICFPGENVIDLSKDTKTDGYNLLYSRLQDIPIVELEPVTGNYPKPKTINNKNA